IRTVEDWTLHSSPDRRHHVTSEPFANTSWSAYSDESCETGNHTKRQSCIKREGLDQQNELNLAAQTLQLMSYLPCNQAAIAVATQLECDNRLCCQQVRQI